jgi:tetratricopeptide (TPR) repeat protein
MGMQLPIAKPYTTSRKAQGWLVKKYLFAGFIASAWLVPTAVSAKVDDLVSEATGLIAQGKPADAYAKLIPSELLRAGDPDFDYLLGLAAADSGHPGVAITALQRVLAVQPDNSQARAEIARVYAMAGDVDTARAEFNTIVADPTIPDPVRQRFNLLVRNYDRQMSGGGVSFTGFADAEAGYDNNINSATNLTSIMLPVFAFLGPATLGGSATRIGQGFAQGQAGVSAQIGLGRQTRLYASVLGLYRDAFQSRDFDQAAITGTAGISHSLANRDVLSLSGQVQQFWLGGDGFRTSYGAIGQYTKALSGGRALSLNVQYSYLDFLIDDLRDADRVTATVTYTDRTIFGSIGGGREAPRDADARHLGFAFVAGNLGAEIPVASALNVTGSISAEHRDYTGIDPLFLAGRIDTQIDASLGLRYALNKAISVRPRATYTRNFSNFSLYDFSRVTASVAIRAEF